MALKQRLRTRMATTALLGVTCIGAAFSSAAAELETKETLSPYIAAHETYLENAWITDIGVLLYSDPDADGYFSGLSLSIDADAEYNGLDVYVVIDLISDDFSNGLSLTGNTTERLHSTQDFTLYGRSSTDEYRVDIDLAQNYSPAVYDLRVALIDAYDNRILDQVGARDFLNLSSLSLESEDYQYIHTPVQERPEHSQNDDVRVVEYSGSAGFGLLGVFVLTLVARVCNRRQVKLLESNNA